MQKINRGEVTKYAFDWKDKPVLSVNQNELFELETDDALSGLIQDDSDNPKVHDFLSEHVIKLQEAWPPKYNPVIGPIYVNGCSAGDLLAVTIESIDPWRYGFSGILPGIGPLGDSKSWKDCSYVSLPLGSIRECFVVPNNVRPVVLLSNNSKVIAN